MKGFIVVLLLAPLTANAAQMYKCTDKIGNVSFQQQPCTERQGQSETLSISNPITGFQAADIEKPDPYAQQIDQLLQDQQIRDAQYQERIDKIDQQHCQYYKDQLTDVEQRWQTIKRQGYRQDERDYWEDRIASSQRDVQRECQ